MSRFVMLMFMLMLPNVSGCTSYGAKAPAGFATFEEGDHFRSASHDGVLFRVRAEDNDPEGELPFWKEALKERMDAAGYVVLGDEDIEASHKKGYLLKLAAPVGTVDYAYWVAIFVHEDEIIIAEATGPAAVFGQHEEPVRKAIGNVSFK